MPKSRGRKPRRNRHSRSGGGDPVAVGSPNCARCSPGSRRCSRRMRPRREGDALGALAIMEEHMVGPDGECFWKHWRLKRLMQLQLFGPLLPGWVTSRWILEQALFSIIEGRRGIWAEAEADRDRCARRARIPGWCGRDRRESASDGPRLGLPSSGSLRPGALDHFLRHQATPDLVAGADSIREWLDTQMGG